MSTDAPRLGPTAAMPHAGLRAHRNGQTKLEQVSEEFEAVMLREVVKSMRATTSLDGSEQQQGSAMLDEMMDDALAGHLARSGGVGLAQYLETIGKDGGLKEDSKPPVNAIRSFYAGRGR